MNVKDLDCCWLSQSDNAQLHSAQLSGSDFEFMVESHTIEERANEGVKTGYRENFGRKFYVTQSEAICASQIWS